MTKSKMRTISFLLLTLFVIVYGILVITTDYINALYSLLFVTIVAVWGFTTDILTKPNKEDDEHRND